MGLLQQLLGIPDNNGDLLSRALSLNDVRPARADWFTPGELDPSAFGMPQQAQREPGAVMARAPVQQVAMPAAVSDTQAPIETTLPASSQAAAAQPRPEAAAAPASPAMPQMAGPSMGERLQAFLMAGGDGSLARGVGSAMGLDRQRETENLTVRALMARGGYSQPDATAIARNPAMLQQVLPSLFGPKNPTKLGPGEALIGGKGEVIARNEEAKPQFHNVAPGGALVGPDGKVVYQADPKQEPPAGYEWVDKADKTKGVYAIEGGPATKTTAELSGKLALLKTAKSAIDKSSPALLKSWGVSGAMQSAIGDVAPALAGEIGMAQRDMRAGIEAALRIMTGAAAPEAEVTRYLGMFMPNARDNEQTATQKLTLLRKFMDEAEAAATQGHKTRANATAPQQPSVADPLGIR